jgi:hypothetical protein
MPKPAKMETGSVRKIVLRNAHLILTALCGLVPVFVAKYFIPFPLPGTGFSDVFFQATLRMQAHGYVTPLVARWGDFVVQSSMDQLYKVDPYDLYWGGSFLLLVIFAGGMFLLAKDLTNNSHIGILSAVFSVFINVGDTYLFYGTPIQHFRSENIIFSIFPFTLLLINRTLTKREGGFKRIKTAILSGVLIMITYFVLYSSYTAPENFGFGYGSREEVLYPIALTAMPLLLYGVSRLLKSESWSEATMLFIISFAFFLFHKESMLVFSLFMLGYILLAAIVDSKKAYVRPLLRTALLLAFLFVFLQATSILQISTTNPFSSLINPQAYQTSVPVNSFPLKWETLIAANELPILALIPIGVAPLFLSRKREHTFPLTLFCFAIFIYFLPDQWTYRAYQVLTPFMAMMLAYSIHWIYVHLGSRRTRFVLITILFLIVVPNLFLPIVNRFSNFPPGRQYDSYMSEEEYDVGIWLRNNVTEYSIVLSDYKTMQMIVPLANKLWPITHYAVWASDDKEVLGFMELLRNEVFLSANDTRRVEVLDNISTNLLWTEKDYLRFLGLTDIKPNVVILLTSRTSEWLTRGGGNYEPLSSEGPVLPSYVDIFLRSDYFDLLYRVGDEIYAFQLRSLLNRPSAP